MGNGALYNLAWIQNTAGGDEYQNIEYVRP